MIKDLKSKHRNIARLTFQGYTPKEISARTETPVQTIYTILRDPMCKSFIDGLSDKADVAILDTRKRLTDLDAKSLETYEELLENQDGEISPNLRFKVAKDVLDRNGHKAPEVDLSITAHFNADDLMRLKEQAKSIEKEQASQTINLKDIKEIKSDDSEQDIDND
ncbi:MAG: hypothetical protein GY861_16695 [bacterium]|nr:hypothetical protein [bacterium]